jgi:hypothetical protein
MLRRNELENVVKQILMTSEGDSVNTVSRKIVEAIRNHQLGGMNYDHKDKTTLPKDFY